jgi:hypothetical protein
MFWSVKRIAVAVCRCQGPRDRAGGKNARPWGGVSRRPGPGRHILGCEPRRGMGTTRSRATAGLSAIPEKGWPVGSGERECEANSFLCSWAESRCILGWNTGPRRNPSSN